MSSVGSRPASGIVITPPMRKPVANPNTTLGKYRLIWRTSSSLPAWPPMNTKPSWSSSGNSTQRPNEVHTASTVRSNTHDAAMKSAAPPMVRMPSRIRDSRCNAPEIRDDRKTPRTAVPK